MADGKEPKKEPKQPHTLADHAYGADLDHEHDGDADHDHDHDHDASRRTARSRTTRSGSQDHVTLTSVGIDIGSAGTQVIFSRLNLRRLGEDLSSRYYVVSRETLFQSPVALTPYQSEERIDDARARRHHRRGLRGRGPASRRHRHRRRDPHRRGAAARERAGDRRPARRAGRRVRLRHRRPPHGGDARRLRLGRGARVARRRTSASSTSTSAAAPPSSRWSSSGRVIATAAVHIGGRLQVVDEQGRIVRLDPAGQLPCRGGRASPGSAAT